MSIKLQRQQVLEQSYRKIKILFNISRALIGRYVSEALGIGPTISTYMMESRRERLCEIQS